MYPSDSGIYSEREWGRATERFRQKEKQNERLCSRDMAFARLSSAPKPFVLSLFFSLFLSSPPAPYTSNFFAPQPSLPPPLCSGFVLGHS